MQMGAEIYGHAGLEADLEVIELAMHCLTQSGLGRMKSNLNFRIDLGDARIIPALLSGIAISEDLSHQINSCIATKDISGLRLACSSIPPQNASALFDLIDLYGTEVVLSKAQSVLKNWPQALKAIDDLLWLKERLVQKFKGFENISFAFDLSDVRGYSYYTGLRFSVYTQGLSDALIRGGRYDEVGAVFGRLRPAVGFSIDLKDWVQLLARPTARTAVKAPWSQDAIVQDRIKELREQGQTVVCMLPGQEIVGDEFSFDRELVLIEGTWVVKKI